MRRLRGDAGFGRPQSFPRPLLRNSLSRQECIPGFAYVLECLLAVITGTELYSVHTNHANTPLCSLIGEIRGAVPRNWLGCGSRADDPEAWVLYAMVFLWQFRTFMSIAWSIATTTPGGIYCFTLERAARSLCDWQSSAVHWLYPVQLDSGRILAQSGLVYLRLGAFKLTSIFFTLAKRLPLAVE